MVSFRAVILGWGWGYVFHHHEQEQGCARTYSEAIRELPLDGGLEISAAAYDAAQGHVVYLTERGQRLAAIVSARSPRRCKV